jgi:hypothetical protein
MRECEVTKVNLPKFPEPQLIVLTLEEAKKISKFFDVVECCASGIKLSDEERILWEIIEKRIEQVEGR